VEAETAPPNGTAVGSTAFDRGHTPQQHRVAEKVDLKDIEKAEHV
jgi:hypothetical protein